MHDVGRQNNVRQDDMRHDAGPDEPQDGVRQDGVAQDAVPQDGPRQDGLPDGVRQDAQPDGVRQDGVPHDGVPHDDEVPEHVIAVEPLPADEAGLETGRDATGEAQPEEYAAQEQNAERATDHDSELFTGDTVNRLRTRWRELQADFVDDPQRAVRGADEVVDEVLRTITEHRQRLAGEWQGKDTEQLRLAMREYRSFVDRLLPTN